MQPSVESWSRYLLKGVFQSGGGEGEEGEINGGCHREYFIN